MMGGENAMEIAVTICRSSKPDVAAMLKKADVEFLPYHLQPESDLFQVLFEESRLGSNESLMRFHYLYIDRQVSATSVVG